MLDTKWFMRKLLPILLPGVILRRPRVSLMGEQKANMLGSFAMARRPDRDKAEILSEKDLTELRHNLAHLSIQAVRDFYEQAYGDCRLVYHRLPSPKQIQTLVQVWKQLWKWR
jgi:hypothetical protein